MSFLYSYYGGMQSNGIRREGEIGSVADDRMIEVGLLFLYRLMFG